MHSCPDCGDCCYCDFDDMDFGDTYCQKHQCEDYDDFDEDEAVEHGVQSDGFTAVQNSGLEVKQTVSAKAVVVRRR